MLSTSQLTPATLTDEEEYFVMAMSPGYEVPSFKLLTWLKGHLIESLTAPGMTPGSVVVRLFLYDRITIGLTSGSLANAMAQVQEKVGRTITLELFKEEGPMSQADLEAACLDTFMSGLTEDDEDCLPA